MNSLSPKLASRVADLTYDLVSDKKTSNLSLYQTINIILV